MRICSSKSMWISLTITMALTFMNSSFWRIHVTMVTVPVEPGKRFISNAEDISCKGLLKGGKLVNGSWKPVGCSIHNYTSSEFKQCLINRYHSNQNKTNILVFVGDSVMLQRYSALVDLLLEGPINFPTQNLNYVFTDSPTFTEIQFHSEVKDSLALKFLDKRLTTYGTLEPNFLMIGVNYWELFDADKETINAVSDSNLHGYQVKVREISKALQTHKADVDIVCALPGPVNFKSIRVRRNKDDGLLTPWLAAQDQYRQRFPHNNDTVVEMYNTLALQELESINMRTMEAFYPLGTLFLNSTYHNDGIYPSQEPMAVVQQILANYLCNSIIHFNDGTCCRMKD